MRPVILVPGMGGSILVRKGQEHKRLFHKRVLYNRWINLESMNLSQRWKRDMAYNVDFDNRCFTAYDPQIIPYEFGSTRGVTDIVSEFGLLSEKNRGWLDRSFNHSYFATLCEELGAAGYRDRIDLLGAPYDFRLILDPAIMTATFEKMRLLIEGGVAANAGLGAVCICHSVGGILFKIFLTKHVDLEWRARYIHNVVYVNVPFSGIPAAIRSVTAGDFYYPALHRVYKDVVQRNSAIVMCMPNRLAYDADEVFMGPRVGVGGDITINNYRDLEGTGVSPSFRMWRQMVVPLLKDLFMPLHCPTTIVICDSGVASSRFVFEGELGEKYPDVLETEPGDCIVPLRSLMAGTKLFSEDSCDLFVMDATHVGVLRSREFIDMVLAKII